MIKFRFKFQIFFFVLIKTFNLRETKQKGFTFHTSYTLVYKVSSKIQTKFHFFKENKKKRESYINRRKVRYKLFVSFFLILAHDIC